MSAEVGAACDAEERVERTLVRATVLFRVGGLGQIAVVVWLAGQRYPELAPVVGLYALVAAESAAVLGICLRQGRLRTDWISADVVACTLGVVVGAAVTAPRDGHSWAHFMYPFTIITSIGIGLAYRRLFSVLAATLLLAVGYAASAMAFHADPLWNVLPNALSYFANTVVAWGVAREFRGNGRAADASRAEAVARALELAEERSRARHARMLHDRVLQTLEVLAQGRWLNDPELQAHVSAEAHWLRAFVEGAPVDQPSDLLAELEAVVQRRARTGLRVEFNGTRLREAAAARAVLEAAVVAALADAAGEALTNVAKHAGVDTATLRAAVSDGHVVVSVLDHGRGFDPDDRRRGIGLDQSIGARLAAVGGAARVESALGQGTYVELSVPLPTRRSPGAAPVIGPGG